MNYIIKLDWDYDAKVWIATSNDIPGLILESGSYDAILERVRFAVPELLELNKVKCSSVDLTFVSTRYERVIL